MNYKIKQIPEDFIVKEKSNVKIGKEGRYSYFILRKTNYTTQKAVKAIANALKIDENKIGFAGNKDKNAVTEQIISIEIDPKRAEKLKLKDIELKFVGKGNEEISLGSLKGNEFEITVRNIDKKPKKIDKVVNYFDEQRFSKYNVEIGKAIIKKDFKKAAELIAKTHNFGFEKYLETKNYVEALRKVPKTLLKLYVHAYASHIWNKTAEKFKNEKTIPVIGFATDFKNKEVEKFVNGLLKKDGISKRDFIIKQIYYASSEGDERKVYADVEDLEIGDLEDDDLNKGKKKCVIKFKLQKGSYATIVIKNLFQ